ncbi:MULTISPECIES: SRPBCC family protein [Pseudoalteromonas]|uniref:SRPBCC family protein n=1 Tax=Pseudoalteromonas TaxID=53246 RepID=UPI00073217BD|nr:MULTISPECIES: SRPBCC family protein [Pseudoalteromonas]KTF17342.1 hypothetical protein ATS74_01120 [Pseudoalteromonas sp. H103]MDO6546688.1 SRPBCC family protein [Pseudoalteromonas carrageenovora]MDO6830659.1 SRPBCC family protein [Pseudoalteromonas carrageenovora]MDO6834187.1 SRPBCC family protein [Pseudoalteromonas carrageenovora]
MIFIKIKKTLDAPPSKITEILLNHKQLGRFFNAKFKLIATANNGELKGGKGAIRQVEMANTAFNEQIISANQSHICYQIIGNKPVANHQGDIYLSANTSLEGFKTNLSYYIQCKAPWWLPNILLKHVITKDITQALNKLEYYLLAGDV